MPGLHDISLLIAQSAASNAVLPDIFALIMAIAFLVLDCGNILALVQDAISNIPLVTKLIGDVITSHGGTVPEILTDIQSTFTMLVGISNLFKSYAYAVWLISG